MTDLELTLGQDGVATWKKPSGGSQLGAAIVRGPFSFAFDTPNLNNGVAFYAPQVDEILLNGWIEVDVAFNGTTPFPEIGTFVGFSGGFFNGNMRLDAIDDERIGAGMLIGANRDQSGTTNIPLQALNSEDHRFVPMRFTAANPLKLVVSQNGLAGGDPVGGTAGSGRVYIITATPVA